MLDRPIAAFDIETIPDPDAGRRIMGLEGSDADVVHEMVRLRLEETDGRSEYPQQPYHRVVCICTAWLEPSSCEFRLRPLGGEAMDERSHLQGFADLLRDGKTAPRLVSWNGNGYDLSVIRYRSMLNGVAAPDLYQDANDRNAGRYLGRHGDMHVDLMDVLTNYGASYRVGLGTISHLMGLPNKDFLDKSICDHILAGEEALVREYCKLDVVDTLLVFLAWLHHQGRLPETQLRTFVDSVRETLRRDPHRAWGEIADDLRNWPCWPREH